MKMTFDSYDAALEKMAKMPNTMLTAEYGITAKDIERMRKNKDKYVPFLMYLSTRDCYQNPSSEKSFINSDAMDAREAAEAIEGLLYDAVELYEDDAA